MYEKSCSKRGYAPPLRPVVLVPPFLEKEIEGSHAELNIHLLMFGECSRYLPHVILALQLFGSEGLGDRRHLGQNRFEIIEATCEFSGQKVFADGLIYPSNVQAVDVRELPPVDQKQLRINFRTPIQLPLGFPPSPEHLLKLIRHRLVLLVNEYGTGEKVPEFFCRGSVRPVAQHYHRLLGYGRMGRREFWDCWTGTADYSFEELDKNAKWLLGVGRFLGAGAKSSFGLGFMDYLEPAKP